MALFCFSWPSKIGLKVPWVLRTFFKCNTSSCSNLTLEATDKILEASILLELDSGQTFERISTRTLARSQAEAVAGLVLFSKVLQRLRRLKKKDKTIITINLVQKQMFKKSRPKIRKT